MRLRCVEFADALVELIEEHPNLLGVDKAAAETGRGGVFDVHLLEDDCDGSGRTIHYSVVVDFLGASAGWTGAGA